MNRYVQLELTPNDAIIIALSLMDDDDKYNRPLIMRIFSVYSGDKTLDLDRESLWYLFQSIDTELSIGDTAALDTWIKVGNALSKFYPQYHKRIEDIPVMPTALVIWEDEHVTKDRDTHEDTN